MTIFVFLFLACSSMHDVGKLLQYDSVRERTQNVQRLNSIAKHESLMDNSSARIMAIKNIGILQPTDQNTLSTLQYLSTHSHPEIRRMSIWSLGEVGRVLEWDEETQNIMVTLQKELLSAPSIKDAQYILESMIKIYCRHVHTVQEDVALVKLLQEYQTKTTNPPDVLYFFEQEIQSLPVLLQILSEKVNDSAQEIYTANMEIFRYLQKNSTTLNHPQYKELVNQTLRAELEQLNSNEIPIQMLGLWILGSTAGDDILQEYVAVELISLVETTPNRQQALLHAALWNMLEIEAVRIYFRTLLQTSDDPYILHTIGVLGYRLDAVHLLYKIESRKTP